MIQKSIPRIIAAVAEHFGTTAAELTGPERTQTICARRAVAYRLCNELTDVPYLQIGRQFGGRDHTSVLRAIAKPLDLQHKIAFDRLSADLTRGTSHAHDVMMRWQFKSRRAAPTPVFIRRHTAQRTVQQRSRSS
ncbi:helix-turn-helix domain-containing protein [Pseudosulfitobacter sp. DSM 107133]|uniref:helix-turn-helix domain-containing protein n=1 Tax=Pseudosulfitobacter sp. DSM 107133 TaxID=2883100 RepID=UPI000DF3CD3B|nr:helix-turn-helix domain-containing protein [Pseudosulfitobacter sp. DSM 107133]UOA25922.1 Chromosomal replication initiator protein DnaA [Pseudosulfitobacter sp. DSM 107133]